MIESSAKSIANAPTKGKREFSQEFLKECFDYKPDTGELFWRKRPDHHFKNALIATQWNSRMAGKKCGKLVRKGTQRKYIYLCLGDCPQLAHRIIWMSFVGPIPNGMCIDHINGDTWDNRLKNLRLATCSQNQQNKAVLANRKHPLPKGVLQMRQRFGARIRSQKGERIYLGTFDTPEEASIAYQQAALKSHKEFTRLHKTPLSC